MRPSSATQSATHPGLMGLPWSIWAISLAGFFLNFSSVIAFVCTPILLANCLGFTEEKAGILEGTVEGFALVVRAVAGMISDITLQRKSFLVWGYGLCVLSRLILPLCTSGKHAIVSRYLEKLGNGIQATPREAFISDIIPPAVLGEGYGLNRTFSMSGSLFGSVLMFVAFYAYPDFHVRTLLWVSGILGVVSFVILKWCVRAPTSNHGEAKPFALLGWFKKIANDFRLFSPQFWRTLGVICLFKLGYFSSNFIMLMLFRHPTAEILGKKLCESRGLAYNTFSVLQCFSCALFAYPLGRLSDMVDRVWVVALGFMLMIASMLLFALYHESSSYAMIYLGIIMYGLQLSMQGAMMALLSTRMPQHLHGTGFGIFFFVTGAVVIFTNNIIMGSVSSKLISMTQACMIIAAAVGLGLALLPWATRTSKASPAS